MAEDRIDSTYVLNGIVQSSIESIEPPEKLSKKEKEYWDKIIAARYSWTDVDLLHALHLAQAFAERYEERKLLKKEGSVLKNERGTPVMNPRRTNIEYLNREIAVMSRLIQVHAQATMGNSRDQQKKNEKSLDIKKNLYSIDSDDLIAMPTKRN
jgi:Pyruvate/2-oxoacid:ferredoxin oxidoreductase gamma subunit